MITSAGTGVVVISDSFCSFTRAFYCDPTMKTNFQMGIHREHKVQHHDLDIVSSKECVILLLFCGSLYFCLWKEIYIPYPKGNFVIK
jgi:hypothetical protein